MTPGRNGHVPLLDRPVLTLLIEEGPDSGLSARFDQPHICLDVAACGDFAVPHPDLFGSFRRTDEGFNWHPRDEHALDQFLAVGHDGVMRAEDTLLRVRIDRIFHRERETGAACLRVTDQPGVHIVQSIRQAEVFPGQFNLEPDRLDAVMRLVSRLNGLRYPDQISDCIVETTFGLYPDARIFSISLLESNGLRPAVVTGRPQADLHREAVLDAEVVDRVITGAEGMLFARDEGYGICAPLPGQNAVFGILQLEADQAFGAQDLDLFCVLASHVAFALERARLTDTMARMFDGFVEASMGAIEARDPATAGHSERVAAYCLALAEAANQETQGPLAEICLSPMQLTELRYAALLHDFGKVGVREAVLGKASRLTRHQIHVIGRRFELILALSERRAHTRLLNDAAAGKPVTAERLQAVGNQVLSLEAEIADEWNFIQGLCREWKLSPAQLRRLKDFAHRTVEGRDGRPIRFLEDSELDNFTGRGTLNQREWDDMRSHVSQSELYLQRIPWSDELRDIPCLAGAHHENLDGTGYPRGITAANIPPRVRMLTIADIFDAATAWDRPYCVPLSIDRAAQLLQRKAERGKLDADLVTLFLKKVLPRIEDLVPDRPVV
ncbi:MAG: HD domain-containing phosphohydrolase [Acidobacteriota bacterium]|nr:HD domain-containing phosphohydrolase [Acidobacteriota bacterium]